MNQGTRKFALVVVTALFGLCLSAAAQMGPSPFSADMTVKNTQGPPMAGKFYYSGQKLRMDVNESGHDAIIIHDIPGQVSYMLMPQQKMYMEMRAGQNGMMHRGPDLRNLRSFDPDHPCATLTNTTCEKAGSETMNGRSTDKWIFTDKTNGQKSTAWIDKKIHFPVRVVNENGSQTDFTNIQEGAPSASLFEIPSGYRKFDMGAMMGGRAPQQ